MNVFDLAARNKANVVRRLFIKRRSIVDGKFESEWLDISSDIKRFGKIRQTIDADKQFSFKFSTLQFTVANSNGRYNDHTNENSLWYGYLNQQRTLVKIECAFFNIVDSGLGYKYRDEYPNESEWDYDIWDADSAVWDSDGSVVFHGVISGDIVVKDDNTVSFNVKPLQSVFEDYAAKNLNCYTTGGITATDFVQGLINHTDVGGNYIFRPFFGNTTTGFNYTATSNVYGNLDTNTSVSVVDLSCWNVLEKLAEVENYVPFIDSEGIFNFVSREAVLSSASVYEFHGAGSFSTEYGNTIKKINGYGFKQSKFYSRVQIKFKEENTSTSYALSEGTLEVSPTSDPWVLGERTLQINNTFFATLTVAEAAADAIYADVSALKRELSFDSTLVLGLGIFDRFTVHYDPTLIRKNSLWDIGDWADNVYSEPNDFIWDKSDGEQIRLSGEEFKFVSLEIDLDNLTNSYVAREL